MPESVQYSCVHDSNDEYSGRVAQAARMAARARGAHVHVDPWGMPWGVIIPLRSESSRVCGGWSGGAKARFDSDELR